MIGTVILHRNLITLPTLNLGKIWSWLKVLHPVRPKETQQVATRAVYVREKGENLPEAIVYRVPDGRYFYTPIEEGTGHLEVNKSQEIINPSDKVTTKGDDFCQPSDIGPKGNWADKDVKAILIKDYYPKAQVKALLAKFSLA